MKNWILALLIIFCLSVSAQDLYLKSYQSNPLVFGQSLNIQVETLENGNFVVAGYLNSANIKSSVFVRMFNPCGDEMWHREITDSLFQLDLISLNIDSNQQILVTGLLDASNQNPKPYLIKLDQLGNTLFSKLLGSLNGYNHLIYSSSIAANGDYLIYGLHRYTTSPPNNQKMSICRMDDNGVIKWAKNYDFGSHSWGRMSSTRDNGALAKTSNTIFKVDSLGNIQWAKNFSPLGSLYAPIETDSGYVFARYYIGAIDRTAFFEIKRNGSLGWTSDRLMNFYAEGNGSIRKNGNLIFSGSNHLIGNGTSFLELDYSNGNILKHRTFNNPGVSNGIIPTSVSETKNQELVYAGLDNRGILQRIVIGKVNDTLSTITCNAVTVANQQDPFILTENGNSTTSVMVNTDYIAVNKTFNILTRATTNGVTACAFTKARGTLELGPDTNLCIGQSVLLGDNNTSFDGYLWSNGSTNKTIAVNQSGVYWLQVISACDTLRDSIQVNYLPRILFWLGADTISCQDSITLGQGLNPSNRYTWSTGETTTSIVVRTSGVYWVEYADKCNSTRDSINVTFQTPPAPIYLGNDTTLCGRQFLVLGDLNWNFDDYLWSNGSKSKTIAATSKGVFWVRVILNCDTLRDTINVDYKYGELLDLGPDTLLCTDSIILGLGLDRTLDYTWSTGESTDTIIVKTSGKYWVQHANFCSTTSDSIVVSFYNKPAPVSLGNDTILCPKQSLLLGDSNSPYDLFTWSDGSFNKQLVVLTAGLYWLEASDNCSNSRDSIEVFYYPEIGLDLGADKSFCKGDLLVLAPSKTFSNYTWSTGANTPSIVVSVAGLYWLEVQTNCGPVRDSILVNEIPALSPPKLGNDTLLCFNNLLELKTNTSSSFAWSTGETSSSILVGEGIYWLSYFNPCDTLRDSISIGYFTPIFPKINYMPMAVKSFDTLTFTNEGVLGLNPIWNFGDGNIAIGDSVMYVYQKAGNYSVSLSATSTNGCLETATAQVEVGLRDYFIPNVFSPNGDRINDLFAPYGDDIESYEIFIYNRWGKLVFNQKNRAWTGYDLQENKLPNAVYQYHLKLLFNNGVVESFDGDITLIR